MGLFFPRYKTFELKCYRAVKCDDNEEGCKIWKKTDSCFENDMGEELANLTQLSQGVQILKICTLMGNNLQSK